MYRLLLLPPYVISSLFGSIFCLILVNSVWFGGTGIPLTVVVAVFVLMGALALVAFRTIEPQILSRMLLTAIQHNGASGGVIVRTSVARATSIATVRDSTGADRG